VIQLEQLKTGIVEAGNATQRFGGSFPPKSCLQVQAVWSSIPRILPPLALLRLRSSSCAGMFTPLIAALFEVLDGSSTSLIHYAFSNAFKLIAETKEETQSLNKFFIFAFLCFTYNYFDI
jgi:hypothetical protein